MKKVILIAVMLMAICLSGFAQTGIYSGGISNKDYRKTGIVIRPELGVDYDFGIPFGYHSYPYYDDEDYFHLSINANLGCQVTSRIYVGGGIGTSIGFEKIYHYNSGTYGRSYVIPAHADFRWYWFDYPSSPFLEVQTGMCYISSRSNFFYFLLTPSIGFDIRNFDIKVGSPFLSGGNGTDIGGISISFGYNFSINNY